MLRRGKFLAAKDGLAAIEFAFIAPIIILVFFGLIELSQGVTCRTRMESVASTTADLVAQATTITDSDRDNIFNAANALMYPYAATVQIKISSLVDDGSNTNKGKVVWSDATANTTAHSVGEIITGMDPGLITPGGSVIMAEVTYVYTPPTKYVVTAPVTMRSTFYSRPRRSVTVTRT